MATNQVFETKHCTIRPFTEQDFSLLYSLHSDPDVMFFIGQGVRTESQIAVHLRNIIEHQKKHGYSAWAVHEKSTGYFVGRVGLVHIGTIIAMEHMPDVLVPVELGYVIAKAHWGKGYATEVARASLEWGFNNTGLVEIVAKTNAANYASQKILQKVGMTFQRYVMIEGRKGMYFSISKDEFSLSL